ncbi:MAG: alpha/beta hydrolase [Lachnospiraceae bacterium]|nr:alpha/beta hydrolase [Lachnospiraceae bacterium]
MKIYIPEDHYQETYENTVVPYLDAHAAKDDFFESFDGAKIHYGVWRADEAKGTIVIVHGFTESVFKFRPLIYVFLNEGCSVCILDQRGHGKSHRDVENPSLTHVDHFEDYVRDLELFIEKVVKAESGPYFLFGHSMGGAVSALYLESGSDFFKKAVLTSPMIMPAHAGVPMPITKFVFGTMALFGQRKKVLFNAPDYSGEEKFDTACASSRTRFVWYNNYKKADKDLYTCNPTVGWALESMKVPRKILKKGAPEKIKTPVLLFSCDGDNMVLRPEQQKFVSRVPGARFETVSGGKHELYRSEDAVLYPYLERVLNFYAE